MKSLAPHTGEIFDAISQLDCIRGYLLVGGTALSLQIHNRLSEDLDFMKWRTSKSEKMEVDWPTIRRDLESIAPKTFTPCLLTVCVLCRIAISHIWSLNTISLLRK